MCTSLTLTAVDGATILARTMDFPNIDPWLPTTLPAGTAWQPFFGSTQTTQYKLVGAARHLDGHYLFGDGLNSAGLSCAELYFPNRVHYYDAPQNGRVNLTPQDFILWVLGSHRSIADVAADLANVALVAHTWYVENKVYPFHWLLADATGQTAVLEPMTQSLHLIDDPVRVLTNTPELNDHLSRLEAYLGNSSDLSAAASAQIEQHSELPTGAIPTNRFIRTAINVMGHHQPKGQAEAQTAAKTYLSQVIIPDQQDGHPTANHNFTHYISLLNVTDLTYTFVPVSQQGATKTYQI